MGWCFLRMLRRLLPGLLCALAALAAGMLAAAGVQAADSPGSWSHRAWLWDFALSAGLVYMAAPLLVLVGWRARGRSLSTGDCVGVALGWYAAVFAVWLALTWMAEGGFPEWGWRHYAVDLLPVPLAMGLVFSLASRAAGPLRRPRLREGDVGTF